MEAGHPLRLTRLAAAGLMVAFLATVSSAADFRTRNFIIHARSPQLAKAVGEAAEKYRRELAEKWLGSPLRPWPSPCPVRVVAGPNRAAQGVTTYNRQPVRDFQMEVVGTPERILDSVLPHEVTHTILATHFGRPLPRWADEGICTTVEHASERRKHEAKLREFLQSRRGIAMNKLFLLTEYPSDVLPMYAQGYSVCRFLIQQKGGREFIEFIEDYMQQPSWTENIEKHYGYESLAELQEYWLAWVASGSGPVDQFVKASPAGDDAEGASPAALASNDSSRGGPAAGGQDGHGSGHDVPQPAGGDAPAATTLASTDQGGGWYLRRRREAKNGSDAQENSDEDQSGGPQLGPATAIAAGSSGSSPSGSAQSGSPQRPQPARIVPPSVRNSGPYSAAQPQPEQQISRGGIPATGPQLGGESPRRWR